MKDIYLRSCPLFWRWEKICEPLLPLKYNGSRFSYTFFHLYNKGCWPEIVVLHNRLSSSSKPRETIIFWIIWCILLPQHSILYDSFAIGFNGKTPDVLILLLCLAMQFDGLIGKLTQLSKCGQGWSGQSGQCCQSCRPCKYWHCVLKWYNTWKHQNVQYCISSMMP